MIVSEARSHNNFTILRLSLACIVFFGHFRMLSGGHSPYANVAVDGFFIVSGYLITSSYDNDPDLRRFFIRRFFRLYPLYLAVVLLQALAMAILANGPPSAVLPDMLLYLAANATFLNFLHPEIGNVVDGLLTPAINPSLWTLKIEVGFYLVLPFLWMLVRRKGDVVLLTVFVLSIVYDLMMQRLGQPTLAKQLPGQMQFFVLGVALYKYRGLIPQADTLPHRLGWAVLVSAAFVVATMAIRAPVIYPLAMAVLMFAVAYRTPALQMRLDLSYGVYLMHGPLIQISLLLGWFRGGVTGFLATALVLAGLALIAERVVEAPFIAIGKRLARLPVPSTGGYARG